MTDEVDEWVRGDGTKTDRQESPEAMTGFLDHDEVAAVRFGKPSGCVSGA